MLKCLAILGLTGAFLLGRPQVAHEQQTPPADKHKEAEVSGKPGPPRSLVVKPSVSAPVANPEPNGGKNDPAEKPLPRFIRPEWVIVYITAIYVFVAWRTLRAIKRQGDSMEDTAKRQLRAYMSVTDGILEIRPDGLVRPRFVMLDCGQTPAYDLVALKSYTTTEWDQRDSLPILDATPSASKGILAPNNRRIVKFTESTLPSEVMSALQMGAKILVIYGSITYRDIFGDVYRLEFQMIHGGPNGWKFPDHHIGVWRTRFRMDSIGNREYRIEQPDRQSNSDQNPN